MQVLIYSAPWCRDCRETKRYLDAHGIAFTEIDIEANPGASDEVFRRVGKRAIPQLVLDGSGFSLTGLGAGFCTMSWMPSSGFTIGCSCWSEAEICFFHPCRDEAATRVGRPDLLELNRNAGPSLRSG